MRRAGRSTLPHADREPGSMAVGVDEGRPVRSSDRDADHTERRRWRGVRGGRRRRIPDSVHGPARRDRCRGGGRKRMQSDHVALFGRNGTRFRSRAPPIGPALDHRWACTLSASDELFASCSPVNMCRVPLMHIPPSGRSNSNSGTERRGGDSRNAGRYQIRRPALVAL